MAVPRLRRLLAQLDVGRHAERVQMMALLGRDHAGDADLARLLDELSGRSDYHHHLALVAAQAARDRERLRAALTHSSPRLRSFAFANLVRLDSSPGEVLQALVEGSAEDRRRLRRFVNRNGRTDIAEAVIDDVRHELGDREAASLLSTCSDETVRRLLPEVLYAVPSLASLARRHPGPLLDHVEGALHDLPRRQRDLLWSQVDPSLPDLSTADPDRVLRMVEELGPSWVIPRGVQSVLGRLIRFSPARLASLVMDARYNRSIRWQLPSALRRNASLFSDADRVAIARSLREREHLFFEFIAQFAPSERARVFTMALEDLDTSAKVWPAMFLEALPLATRHAEARRILGLRAIRDVDASRLQYTAFLPFADARPALEPELSRAKAEHRAVGYSLLIACAGRERSPHALGDALRLTRRLHNEQDPVRLAAVQSLAAVSPIQVTDEHLDDVETVVEAVVEARDTSPATIQMLTTFAFRLLGASATDLRSPRCQFALHALDELAGPAGAISFPLLDRLLPVGADTALIDALMPRLERDAARDRHHLALSLAQSLRKRAWGHAGLQAVVARATSAASDSVVRRAIGLWLADPRTRGERAGRVVAGDESTVADPVVLASLNRSRQDLLDVLLRTRPLRGRFLKGDIRYVPVIRSGFERWLPRQCESYRSALEDLIATPGTAVWSKTAAVQTLARLPEIGVHAVRPYLDRGDIALQEAALAGLAWTDRPGDALDELLSQAGSDRARVAVYAATRCARFVPRNELGHPLLGVIGRVDAKVTSKKEAARLLGLHRPPGSVDFLVELGSGDDIHRDVRIATGRALRGAVDDDRVWQLYGRLSSGADDEARSLLETAPTQLPPRHRPRYAGLILEVAQSAGQQVRSEAFNVLGAWAPWATEASAVAAGAIGSLDAGLEWHAALGALGEVLRDGAGWDQLSGLVATLAGRTDGPEFDAGAERDQPSRQRLVAVLTRVANLPPHERSGLRAKLLRVADLLEAARSFSPDFDTMRPVFGP